MLKKTKEYFKKRGFDSRDMYEMFEKYYLYGWSISKIARVYDVAPYRVEDLVVSYTKRRINKRRKKYSEKKRGRKQ